MLSIDLKNGWLFITITNGDKMKLKREYSADYSLCDCSGSLSIQGASQIIENSIAAKFELMGCGNLTLRAQYNAMWVFVKNYIHIDYMPKCNESFRVEVYCVSFNKLKCIMETDFIDSMGNVFAYSVLVCCLLDTNSHMLRTLNSIPFPMDDVCDEGKDYAFTGKTSYSFSEIEKVHVRTTDVDYSKHVNNVSYIRYALNTYTVDQLISMKIHTIEIYYLKETKEGSILSVSKYSENGLDLFSIKNEDTEVFSIHFRYEV